jgi:hypothetical protein
MEHREGNVDHSKIEAGRGGPVAATKCRINLIAKHYLWVVGQSPSFVYWLERELARFGYANWYHLVLGFIDGCENT